MIRKHSVRVDEQSRYLSIRVMLIIFYLNAFDIFLVLVSSRDLWYPVPKDDSTSACKERDWRKPRSTWTTVPNKDLKNNYGRQVTENWYVKTLFLRFTVMSMFFNQTKKYWFVLVMQYLDLSFFNAEIVHIHVKKRVHIDVHKINT